MRETLAKSDETARTFEIRTGSGVLITVDDSRTSSTLLRKAKAFDEEGWQLLVDTYGDRIYRWARRTRIPPQDATDITAEVFVAIVRKIRDFRRDREQDGFRKWVRTITKNKIRDYWRSRQRVATPVGGSDWQHVLQSLPFEWTGDAPSASRATCSQDSRSRIYQTIIDEVSARDWAIFQRLIVDEQTASDVAQEFGISINVVYLVKSRLMKRLRELATGF